MSEPCPFCEIATGRRAARIVYEDDATIGFVPLYPATPGHTLVIPKKHIKDLWSIDLSTAQRTLNSTLLVSRAVRAAFSPEGLNIINSTGEVATQTIFHFHVHVVPRWTDDAMGEIWPRDSAASSKEMDEMAYKVREACDAVRL